mmetsp:Transcript_8077/g.14631  ORF Transcript_8077/g.14631 Transcript_8077/m.14631 type:complete len:95 (+) Transcript_8077:739-1023(+)
MYKYQMNSSFVVEYRCLIMRWNRLIRWVNASTDLTCVIYQKTDYHYRFGTEFLWKTEDDRSLDSLQQSPARTQSPISFNPGVTDPNQKLNIYSL